MLSWGAENSEDPEELVDLRVTLDKTSSSYLTTNNAMHHLTWNSGFLVTISAKIVPRDQMSRGQEYFGEPSSTSGALWNSFEIFTILLNPSCNIENFELVTPVPKSDHFVGVNTDRNPKSPVVGKRHISIIIESTRMLPIFKMFHNYHFDLAFTHPPCQTKVCNLDGAMLVYQEVGRLQVPASASEIFAKQIQSAMNIRNIVPKQF